MKNNTNICCGCLTTNRQMLIIDDKSSKQCFFQIISEISMLYLNDEQLKLCWECERYIRKWVKFKEQVKYAYKTMHDLSGDSFHNIIEPRLATRTLYHFEIKSLEEIDTLQTIKDEFCNYTDLSNSHYQINIHNEYHNDTLTTKSVSILSNKNTIEQKEQVNNSDVSDNDIYLSFDGNVSNIDNAMPNDDINLTAVKVDSDDELLVTFSKDFDKKKKRDNMNGGEKLYCNGASQKKKKTKKRSTIYKEIRLSKEEMREERKMAELKEDYVNAMFRCEKCIISFPNSDDLEDHVKFKHELESAKHKCSVCECVFSSIVSYNYHKRKHKIKFECVICKERYPTTRSVIKHYEITHWQRIGETEFNIKTEDTPISNGSNTAERFPCELCDKTFKWKTSLRKHVETHSIETGQKRKPYCAPCRLSFSTTSNLRKHVKSSSNHQIQLKLIKLKQTDTEEPPNSEKQVARIQQIKSLVLKSTQQYRCPHCDRMFQWRGNLHRHMANHAARASGELICKPCNRTFSSIETYNQHMKISKKHVTENNFKFVCSECGKRFSNKTKLKDHIDWEHLKNYNHICTLCEKVFKSRTSLFLHHRAVHKKDRLEHLCDHCGKAFPNQVRLRAHIEGLHTNETPYKCGICPSKFNWQACLSRHVKKVHGNHKRFKDGTT